MIHAAIMGSIDRFLSILIEHTGGIFPLWLSPVQVKVLPISDKHVEYAQGVVTQLRESNVRVELDDSSETLGKKVRNAKVEKVPYMLVIGDKEVESGTVSVERRDPIREPAASNGAGKGKIGVQPVAEFINNLAAEIKSRA